VSIVRIESNNMKVEVLIAAIKRFKNSFSENKSIALRLKLNKVIRYLLGKVALKPLASHLKSSQNRKTICEATTLYFTRNTPNTNHRLYSNFTNLKTKLDINILINLKI